MKNLTERHLQGDLVFEHLANNDFTIRKETKGIEYEIIVHSFKESEIDEIRKEVDEYYERKNCEKNPIFRMFSK